MDRARLAKHRFSIGSKGKRELSVDEEMRNTYQLHEHESAFFFLLPSLPSFASFPSSFLPSLSSFPSFTSLRFASLHFTSLRFLHCHPSLP